MSVIVVPSLVEIGVRSVCRLVYEKKLSVQDAEIPHEIVSKMVTFICQNGLVSAGHLEHYLRPAFSHISVPGCILVDDTCVDVITRNCPLIKSLNCAQGCSKSAALFGNPNPTFLCHV